MSRRLRMSLLLAVWWTVPTSSLAQQPPTEPTTVEGPVDPAVDQAFRTGKLAATEAVRAEDWTGAAVALVRALEVVDQPTDPRHIDLNRRLEQVIERARENGLVLAVELSTEAPTPATQPRSAEPVAATSAPEDTPVALLLLYLAVMLGGVALLLMPQVPKALGAVLLLVGGFGMYGAVDVRPGSTDDPPPATPAPPLAVPAAVPPGDFDILLAQRGVSESDIAAAEAALAVERTDFRMRPGGWVVSQLPEGLADPVGALAHHLDGGQKGHTAAAAMLALDREGAFPLLFERMPSNHSVDRLAIKGWLTAPHAPTQRAARHAAARCLATEDGARDLAECARLLGASGSPEDVALLLARIERPPKAVVPVHGLEAVWALRAAAARLGHEPSFALIHSALQGLPSRPTADQAHQAHQAIREAGTSGRRELLPALCAWLPLQEGWPVARFQRLDLPRAAQTSAVELLQLGRPTSPVRQKLDQRCASGEFGPRLGTPVAEDTPPEEAGALERWQLELRITRKFGRSCALDATCGELLGVDCGAATDGAYLYVQADDLSTVEACGGACMGKRCTNCPPKQWTCER